MWPLVLTPSTLVLVAILFNPSAGVSYQEVRDCQATNEHLYKYTAEEEYFGDDINQTLETTVYFQVYCKSVGMYGGQRAILYDLQVTDAIFSGNILERVKSENENGDPELVMTGWFQFIQTEDGSIPVTLFSREEDQQVINIKKAIVSAFQANFGGTRMKEEADPQSLHMAEYTYEVSAQDIEDGVLRMHRTITSDDVENYASHIPADEVKLNKEEDIMYQNGVLKYASGVTSCKLMPKENERPEDDVVEDILEAQPRKKRETNSPRDPDEIKTYDATIETNKFESKGSYVLELVGQRRLLQYRRSRSTDDADLSNLVESSLLAFINHTHRAVEYMMKLHQELGDIKESLRHLHFDSNTSAIAHKIETLVKLESQYAPLPHYSPAIDDVLHYLKPILGSNKTEDIRMRFLVYFIISPEGSIQSQLALLNCLERAVNHEEVETVIMYLAMVVNPQPQFVAKFEKLISSDVHSGDPLLLAYGAIISRASPILQQHMTLFLTNRLQEAETNSSSLIHHILTLGNSASPNISNFLIDYLSHPEVDVQLTSILAMRFIMNESLIQKSLQNLLTTPDLTEGHIAMIVKALIYGSERAKINNQEKPYSYGLAEALVISAAVIDNEELHMALTSYLQTIGNKHSLDLINILNTVKNATFDRYASDTTRLRRGTQWDESNSVYDLVAPLSERQNDVQMYQNRLSYIWGKQFGGRDISAEIAAGGFVGVSDSGSYKVFGKAIAKAKCYDRSLTFLEFLILRRKSSSSTVSQLYANVLGYTLQNIYVTEDSSVCDSLEKPIYEGREYTVFGFTLSIFVVVGTLNFRLAATVKFTAGMYVEFCDNQGSVTVGAGMSPTITLSVSATGDLEIIGIAKAGLTLTATFNYQVLPEVNSQLCYTNSQVRVKNCIGVYHQWADNSLELYAWYAWRGWCGWWVCTGSDAYQNINRIDSLSWTWDLPGTSKLTIWELCDQSFTC